jgi:hypothetical protein
MASDQYIIYLLFLISGLTKSELHILNGKDSLNISVRCTTTDTTNNNTNSFLTCSATSLTQHIRNERHGGRLLTVERKEPREKHNVSLLPKEGRYLCAYSTRWVKTNSGDSIFCCRP